MELKKNEIDLLADDQLDCVAGGMRNLPRVTPMGTTSGSADPSIWGPFAAGTAGLAFSFAILAAL